ncbi:MAG: beta strand repeat-containing protein, partial [bacterium]
NLTANGVQFLYNSAGNQFQIATGSVSVATSAVNFSGIFGSGNTPGLVMTGSSLTAMDITVNSNMNVAGLNLTANGVEFIYNSVGSQFEIATGNVSVSGTGFYFDGLFGSGTGANATPGLTMSGSNLTGLDITVSSLINLDGMTLTVDNLQFIYENNANSDYNGDFLINTGTVTIATSAKDTFFEAQFGNAAVSLPGLVIHNGELSSLYTVITSTINAQNLVFNANGLVFDYQGATQNFEIASGSVSISSGDIQFASASFGVSGNPGLEINNGVLTQLNVTINSSMNVQDLSLNITSMQLIYYAVAGQTSGNFEIAAGGSVSLTTGSSAAPLSFSGLFGTNSNGTTLPGLVINNGDLQSFYIGINSNISAAGLVISTTGLTFAYNSAGNTFQIPGGSISVVSSSGDFNFNGTFGSTLSNGTSVPGLVVSNGFLDELNTVVTSKLVAGGLTFALNNLNFYYNSSGNQFEIDSGNISFNTNEGFSFSANFGLPNPANTSQMLPGLVVSGGSFTEFSAALYASFTVAGLVINVDDMAMVYNSSQFEMYGTVTVNTTDVNFQGIIGQPTASPPVYGLVIDNGNLESLAITINSNVSFSDLSMQAQGLSFNYDSSPESFSLYGNVSISIDGVNLTGLLGNATLPGLSLVNGQLETLNLGVTTDFTLFGLNCNINDLTFIYEASSSTYIMYGALSVSIADGSSTQKISATMGTQSNPGLTIVGSTVTEINMSLNADFTVDGFSFEVVDAGIMYQASDDTYQIYGTFTLSDVFSASVQLGTQANPGIIVSNSVFIVNEIAISLDNVAIGAFTLNYVDISYDSSGNEWQGAAAVTFPTGWQIGASMTFINGNLDDISLFYSAGKSQGIAIPDTGIFVTYIEASLQNLDDPVSIIVSGSIVGDFGGQISIGGVTCRIFTAMGSFSADGQQLSISGDYYLGAYQSNNSNPLTGWTGILGSGSASVDLNWSAGTYTASMSCSLYGGIFVISAEMAFNDEGDLGLIATATVEVPSEVPFIGGTKLGSMSFAFIYTASSNSGLVAAWATVNCGINITTGFQYNFSSGSSGSFALIGAGGVNNIENDFNSITSPDNSVPPTYIYSYSVTVPSGSGSNGVSVQAIWPSNSGTQTIAVSGPNDNGTYYTYTTSSNTVPSTIEFLTAYTTPTSQSALYSGSSTSTSVLLTPGTYNFQIQSSYEFSSTSCVTWSNQLYYESPNITVGSVPAKALAFVPNLTGFAAGVLVPNTTVTLYIDIDNSGYNGKSSGTFAYSVSNTTTGGTLLNVPSLDLSSYAPGVPLYIYAVINDGTNTAVTSAYSAAVVPVPNLIGNVIDQFGNPLSGIRMFLDLNNNQMYDSPVYASNGTMTSPGEPTVTTNSNGSYYFNGLESYSSTDIGYPNFRVMALMPSPSFTPITPANATVGFTLNDSATSSNSTVESVVANFTINRLASISGSIYSDLLQTGVYNASDPALSGATVYLDINNNGQYDTGEMTCETGPSGTFGFFDLTPGNYTMGIITSSTSGNTTIQNYLVTQPSSGTYSVPITSDAQQLVNYTFGVISLATVSGTVYSQPTSSSIASPLANSIVQISTPNKSASVPNYSNFTNSNKLNLNSAVVTSSGSLSLVSSTSSCSTSSAWYSNAIPLTGGFESV